MGEIICKGRKKKGDMKVEMIIMSQEGLNWLKEKRVG